MQRFVFLASTLWLTLTSFGASDISRVAWSVDTANVKAYPIDLVYGETVRLECKFTSYSDAFDLSDSAVVIHARTNGMAEGQSWQAVGYPTNGGVAVVRVNTSSWLPPGPTTFNYTLEASSTKAITLRAFGQLRIRPSYVASTNAPLPIAYFSGYVTTGALADVALQVETNTVKVAATNGWETGSHAAFLTNAPPQSVVSVNGQTGAVVITAAGIGALTNETDLAALRLYHYGSPDIIESPTNWFTFDGAGTITGINSASVTNWNIVIPWQIGGVPVTAIGGNAFSGQSSILSITFPSSVTTIGSESFYDCSSLESLVFNGSAPSMYFGLLGNASPSIIVKNPTATGWGRVVSDGEGSIPILRPVVFTDALTLNGVTYTNLPDVSGLATTQSVNAVAGGLDLAAITLNNHTDNGAIGSDAHASSIEKAAWNAKLDASGGTASNLTVNGFIALPQSAPTNLVLLLVCSNEHIYVEEVYP